MTLSAGGTLYNLSGSGTVSFGAEALTLSNSVDSVFSGILKGTGTITKTGSGNLTLDYDGRMTTFTGRLVINQGGLTLGYSGNGDGMLSWSTVVEVDGSTAVLHGKDNILGYKNKNSKLYLSNGGALNNTNDSGHLTVSPAVYMNNGKLTSKGAGSESYGNFILDNIIYVQSGEDNIIQAENVLTRNSQNHAATACGGVFDVSQGAKLTIPARIMGANVPLVKDGAGELVLTGVSDFTKATTVNAGKLILSGKGNLTGTSGVTIASGATLEFTNSNADGAGGAVTFNRTISGAGNLVKSGTGTVILAGANTYSGKTTVDGGKLTVSDGGKIAGAGIDIGLTTASTMNIQSGGSVTVGSATANADVIVGSYGDGTLLVENGGSFVSTGNIKIAAHTTNTGNITVQQGGYLKSRDMQVGSWGNAVVDNYGAIEVTSDIKIGRDGNSFTGKVNVYSGATLTANIIYPGVTMAGELNVNGGTVTANTVALHGRGTNATGTVTITNKGSLTTGTLQLGNDNYQTSAVNTTLTLDDGTLSVVNVTYPHGSKNKVKAAVNLGKGTVITGAVDGVESIWWEAVPVNLTYAAGTNIQVDNGKTVEFHGAISGTGGFNKTGAGTMTLTKANSYSGNTTISAGTLKLANSGALFGTLGTSAVTVSENGTLEIAFASPSTSVNISSIQMAKTSSFKVTTGAVTFGTANVTLNNLSGGYLEDGQMPDPVPATLTVDGKLTLNNDQLTKFIGSISAQEVEKTGDGTLKLCFDAQNAVDIGSLTVSSGRVDIKGYMQGGITINDAVFSPGNSIGEATFGGGFILNDAGSELLMEIGGQNTDQNDSLIAGGNIELNNGLIYLDLADNSQLKGGDTFTAILYGSNSGEDGFAENLLSHVSSYYFTDLDYVPLGNGVYAITGTLDANAVPEPSTWALLALGVAGLLYVRKRKN